MSWTTKAFSPAAALPAYAPGVLLRREALQAAFARVPCRVAFKRHSGPGEHRCPRCSEPMVCAGHDFAAPRRRDTKAWTVVAAAQRRTVGREPCDCSKEPKFGPRTRVQLRAGRIAAPRTGTPLADMLGRADPSAQPR